MSYCPACGHPVGEAPDTRFCARCGRDLSASAAVPAPTRAVPPAPPPPAVPPPAAPPPPALPPGPPPAAGPSPAALFARRVAAGRWERPVLAGALPALAVLGLALVIGVATGVATRGGGVGLATRTRMALALLLQGVGGSLEFTRHFHMVPLGEGFSDGSGVGSADLTTGDAAHSSVSLVPWTVTLLWVTVLVIALHVLFRRRPPAERGADAAVRVSLAAAAAVLVLGFAAQPTVEDTELHTRPFVAALAAFALTLAVSLLVLCRTALDAWLAARPGRGPATAFRALGTAAAALLLTLLIAGAVVFLIVLAHYDQLTGWGVAGAALLLFNLGVSGLGLAWGAPFRVGGSDGGDGSAGISFGLSDLDHVWGAGSVAGVVAGGIGCALLIGVLAAWRSRDRVEMFTVAAVYTGLFTLLAAVSGVANDGDPILLATGSRHTSMATSVPEALAFALLWSFGGVACGPYVWRALGGRTDNGGFRGAARPAGFATERTDTATSGAAAAAAGAAPGVPPVPPGAPTAVPPAVPPAGPVPPTVHDLGIVQPERLKKDPPSHG